ncbi:MAG: response regulator [Planctomycetota bacterium]|jgi:CheY-like chemotaxis protein
MKRKKYLSLRQISKRLNVHRLTILQWFESGLKHQITPTGRYKVNPADLDEFLESENRFQQRTILLVDDDQNFLDVTSKILQRAGYKLIVSDNIIDAIFQMKTFIPELVILDLCFPEKSGWEFADISKADKRLGKIPILFVSGVIKKDQALDKYLKYNGVGFLEKPISPDELVQKVRGVFKALTTLK